MRCKGCDEWRIDRFWPTNSRQLCDRCVVRELERLEAIVDPLNRLLEDGRIDCVTIGNVATTDQGPRFQVYRGGADGRGYGDTLAGALAAAEKARGGE